jgi:hypothetical protein
VNSVHNNTNRRDQKCIKIVIETLNLRDKLRDPGVDWNVILQLVLSKHGVRMRAGIVCHKEGSRGGMF